MRSPMVLPLAAVWLAVLLLPAWAGPAWSATDEIKTIRIQKISPVSQKEVSLAEICDPESLPAEWRARFSAINIGDAPPAGSEKPIDPAQLRSYLTRLLDSYGVNSSEVVLDIPDRVQVRREAVQITQEQIETIFKKFVHENSPWREHEINIQRVHFSGLPLIPTGPMSYEVNVSPRERFIGNVTASIDFYVNGEKARTLGVVGKVDVFGNVYIAARPLRHNEIVTPADVKMHRVNITDSADRFASRLDQVENRRVLRNIGVNQPLELKDLDKPLVLKRGDHVMIVYDQPGLQVTAKGQVNVDGGIGDTLAVTNISSRKTVHCRVLDAQTVRAAR